MPALFIHPHTVLAEEIDPQGHANNIAYLHWMQAAAVAHSTAQGWSGEAYRERGWAWVVRSHFIKYRQPARLGDALEIRTCVANMQRFTSLRKFEIVGPQGILATAETNWAFVETATERLLPIPAEVAQAFELLRSPRPSAGETPR